MSGQEPSRSPKKARMTAATSPVQAQTLSPSRMVEAFDAQALKKALDGFFLESRPAVSDETETYTIQDCFGSIAPYWVSKMRPGRFSSTKKNGLLNRPEIVEDIIEVIEAAMTEGSGVVVKGPNGVGKSHSLVNVVRKLESTGDYLVTFIPDCHIWIDTVDLYDAICESFGSTIAALDVKRGDQDTRVGNLNLFVGAIDQILKGQGKKWVFVIDQVNKLFAKFKETTDVGLFDFPYNQIRYLLLEGRRTCVISASANNETTNLDNQDGFKDFNYTHPLSMEKDELRLAFLDLRYESATYLDNLVALTGGVPWQVHLRLQLKSVETKRITKLKMQETRRIYSMKIHHATREKLINTIGKKESVTSIDKSIRTMLIDALDKKLPLPNSQKLDEIYAEGELARIMDSLVVLKAKNRDGHSDQWKSIVNAAISCLMNLETSAREHDRKYSVWENQGGQNRVYKPLHPIVLDAYQAFFWDDVMTYVHNEERALLKVCKMPEMSHDAIDRIFRALVIQRCRQGKIAMANPDVLLPEASPLVETFHGQRLPEVMLHDGMYVPLNCTFPAIDLLWKSGKNVWGVRVQVNEHKDVLHNFSEMCKVAKWDTTMENVYLVYLSPEKAVAKFLLDAGGGNRVDPQCPPWIPKVQVLCSDDIDCLENLKWPAGCSLLTIPPQCQVRK